MISKEKKTAIINEYARTPGDTGSPEVQVAVPGNYIDAVDFHFKYRDMIRLLFADGNPAGVKCVMHDMGLIENELRLPLVPVSSATAEEILTWVNKLK